MFVAAMIDATEKKWMDRLQQDHAREAATLIDSLDEQARQINQRDVDIATIERRLIAAAS
jgi:hypothetical protein